MIPNKRQCAATFTRILDGNDLHDLSTQVVAHNHHWFNFRANAFVGLVSQLYKNQLLVPGIIPPNDTLSKLYW